MSDHVTEYKFETIEARHHCRQCPVPIPESMGGSPELNEAKYQAHLKRVEALKK